jgi:hypothetical protein
MEQAPRPRRLQLARFHDSVRKRPLAAQVRSENIVIATTEYVVSR